MLLGRWDEEVGGLDDVPAACLIVPEDDDADAWLVIIMLVSKTMIPIGSVLTAVAVASLEPRRVLAEELPPVDDVGAPVSTAIVSKKI